MKKYFKYLKYLLVLILPLLILDVVLIMKYGIDGFCELFIVEDLNAQYMSLIRWIQDVLQGDANLFYSFSKGIGGNMFSTFTYYLSSPLNLILIFFEKFSYVIAICLLIHLKIGLSSITMFIYLKQKFKDSKYLHLLLFSTIYALSGAIINFYSNIMWLDIYYLTPLVILGLEKIVSSKSNYLYIISLSLAMISNFYMAFMLCIFCVIYFIYNILLEQKEKDKKEFKKIIKYFLFSSIISALIAGVIIVPTIMDMTNMYRYDINKPILYFDIESISMIFSKLFIGSMSAETMYSHNEANVYISLFSLVLVILFFFDKKNTKREKILTTSVMLVFLISIIFNGLNLIWHGFSFPNGYNYRFVYFWAFFLTMISYKEFLSITKHNKTDKSFFKYLSIVLFFIILLVCNEFDYLSNTKIIITIIFIGLYLFYIFKNKKYKMKPTIAFALVIIELGININYCFITKETVNEWYKDVYNTKIIDDVAYYSEKICSDVEETFFRNDMENFLSYNDGLICNYSSISTALSTNHARYYEFLANAGFSVTYSTILDDFSNGPFIDSILGLKYFYRLDPTFQAYYKFYDKLKIEHDDHKLNFVQYENPYALSLGYIIDQNDTISFEKNAFEYQNQLAKKMSGLNVNIFEKVEAEELSTGSDKTQTLKFFAEDKYYYIYNYIPVPINTTYYGTMNISPYTKHTYVAGDNGIVALEEHVVNQDIVVSYTSSEEYKDYIDLQIYSFNQENFEKIINKLKENQLNIAKRRKNILEGAISIQSDDSLMMVTVPYEKGWHIYVDGKKVEYEEVYDTFVGIRLDKGVHEIKMVFYSPGIVVGSLITIIGISIFLIPLYKNKLKYRKRSKKDENK